ncbi:hypothetical protein DES53_10849 [Roseimicrobium gellanilyticum]|uniref:Uncharacterized protein n=1 Tax=Roseimicrobium gellanilyticum TaxID=748857 RepID=A0A366HD11_9BACT|nr:hypothetical protein [Roseimicrobium gellanilyticum]RBP40343.1 hypothetical protein DES53_10849 [Roseimicrobium gellanilyticum]
MTELDSLALKLATVHATDLIQGEALSVDGRPWFDASAAACEGNMRAIEALRFLELAGLLENHPTNPDLVRTTGKPGKPKPLVYDAIAA